ncbi:MAG: VPDSG-CTERM sorting domain-containing protein [Verrucomicrobia bacterium]|nr:VPDSG-CTERM sorting domain-containing protein [Verrucomicrobiota bacterium]
MKKTSLAILALIGIVSVTTASAITVGYSLGDWSQQFTATTTPPAGAPHSVDGWGYPGDTVTLQGGSGSFVLADGATYTNMPIGTLLWGVDYTYNGTTTQWDYPAHWPDLTFAINAIRSMIISGDASGSGNLGQAGTLKATWDDDYLSLAGGPMSSVYVPGFRIDITPNSLPVATVNSFGGGDPPPGGFAQTPRSMTATFQVSAVPDGGTTLVLLGGALTGLGALRRKFRA